MLCIWQVHPFQKLIIFVHAMISFLKKARNFQRLNTKVVNPHRIGDGVRLMNTATRPISEISRRATDILFRELGVVETIRFLNQFSVGPG